MKVSNYSKLFCSTKSTKSKDKVSKINVSLNEEIPFSK